MESDFFVSYTESDGPWAEWIAWHLQGAGYRVTLQAWDFVPGSNWVDQMHRAVAKAARTVPVLSPAYFDSAYGTAEWQAAWRTDALGDGRVLVPVRVKECRPTGLLGGVVWIDLVGLDEDTARNALLDGVHSVIANGKRPRAAPPFPSAAGVSPRFPGPQGNGRQGEADLEELVERVKEVCLVRHKGARIIREGGSGTIPVYLDVTWQEDGFAHRWPIGVNDQGLERATLNIFAELVHSRYKKSDPGVESEFVYAGKRPSDDLVRDARQRRIRVLSVVEYQRLWDPRGYVDRQTSRLREDPVYPPSLYVPQRFRLLNDPDRNVRENVFGTVIDWLNADHARFVLVLGDFGHGKTFLLRELARRIPAQLPHLTPVLVELRALEKNHSLDALIAQHLAAAGEDRIDLPAFRHMLRRGQIVLLFDGFDELALRVTYDRAADHLQTMLSAVEHRAKVVLTSRTQHFASDAQIHTALGDRVQVLAGSRLVQLADFDETQIQQFLLRLFEGDQSRTRTRLDLIRQVKDLLGLSGNPRMLSFIAALGEDRLLAAGAGGGEISSADIYRELLDAWLGHEARRSRPTRGAIPSFDATERRRAVTELALRLWRSAERGVSVDDLQQTTARLLTSLTKKRLDAPHAAHAIGSATLLVREDDVFTFVHSSVMEYLVAAEAARLLGEGSAVADLLEQQEMSPLMVHFLCGLADRREALDWAAATLTSDASHAARTNALAVTRLFDTDNAGVRLIGADLRGQDLSGRDLRRADLSGADLTDARLIGTDLTGALLRDATLVRAYMERTRLAAADLSAADLREAELTHVDLRDATLGGSRWSRARLLGVTANQVSYGSAELADAAIPGRDPAEVFLAPGGSPGCLAFAAEGELVVAGWGSTVALSDAGRGRMLRLFYGHDGTVLGVAFSPDGRMLASVSDDGVLRIWAAETGQARAELAGHQGRAQGVAFAPDGLTLASAGEDGTIRLWDVASGEQRKALVGGGSVLNVVFSPNGALLASVGDDRTIRLWDAATGRRLTQLACQQRAYRALAFSPSGTLLASGSAHGAVALWEVATGTRRADLTGHQGAVLGVAFSPDGTLLASASADGTIQLREVATGQHTGRLTHHRGAVLDVAFSADGCLLASAGADGTIRSAEVATGRQRATLTGHQTVMQDVAFSPDGTLVAGASADCNVQLWEVGTARCRGELGGHQRTVRAVAFSPTGKLLASASADGVIRLWDVAAGALRGELVGHQRTVRAIAFSPEGRTLASASGDKTVRLWDVDACRQRAELTGHRGWTLDVGFNADGTLLASASDDRSIRLWRVSTAQLHGELSGHEGAVLGLAFSPDSALLASGGGDGTVRLWDVAKGRQARVIAQRSWVLDVAFSPDGKLVASAGGDGTIRLWEVSTGRRLARLAGHHGTVLAATFSPDGALLASAGGDGTIRLWDTHAAVPLATLIRFNRQYWVALLADGSYKLAGEPVDSLWWAVRLCRFPPGALDAHMPTIRRRAALEQIPLRHSNMAQTNAPTRISAQLPNEEPWRGWWTSGATD